MLQVRLGDILVERGLLTDNQVEQILNEQKKSGDPFGLICERMFDISPEAVEEAWETQYLTIAQRIDPSTEIFDDHAHDLVTRRQAWQFRVLPVRFEGEELILATSENHLRRALRFATKFICVPVFIVIAEPELLGEALCKRYPLAGMTADSINDDSMDRLLEMVKNSTGSEF